jgi:hypothetical protein
MESHFYQPARFWHWMFAGFFVILLLPTAAMVLLRHPHHRGSLAHDFTAVG